MAKLIAVTGNGGKSVFSFFLADTLADKEHHAILIGTDGVLPTLQILLPPLPAKAETKSLGKVLSAAIINKKAIFENLVTLEDNKYMGILSYSAEETANNYPRIPVGDIETLFGELAALAEYIVVDTQTIPNELDKYAAAHCDHELCITTGDCKGLAYRTLRPKAGVIPVLFQSSPANPIEDMKRTFPHQLKYTIPYNRSLTGLYNGEYISGTPIPRAYGKLLNKLIQEVILSE